MDKTTPLAPLRTFLEAKGSPLFEIITYLMVASLTPQLLHMLNLALGLRTR